jgi:serine/threonine protein kinase
MIEYSSFEKLTGSTLGNYRLEQLISQDLWGPVFLARADTSATTYLLRILPEPANMASRDRQTYLEHFQYHVNRITALQHPNILPLLDYGIYHGMPYLVSPYLSMRSLHTRLAKNGPVDVFTVGRYLDQITATLEYAHQHAVLHGNLSADCIFIRLDGQIVVSNFGLRNLLLMDDEKSLRGQLTEWSGACAPEQLLGKPVGTYTDVYALGTVLYSLLTGEPVFSGNTPQEVAQQHLYAAVPPLSRWRSDLPAGLYTIIARALAKDPAQRFQHPGALANTYHRNVDPNNRQRVPFAAASSPAILTQESFPSRASLTDEPFTEYASNGNGSSTTNHVSGAPRSSSQSSIQHSLHGFSDDSSRSLDNRRSDLMRRFGRRQKQPTLLIASVIAVLVIVGSILGTALLLQRSSAMSGTAGQVVFFSSQPGGTTDALHITIQNLAAPPSGYQYMAWIINTQTENVIGLGSLTGKNQTWSLIYNAGNSNLLESGEKFEVTQEQGTVKAPTGNVIVVAAFPVKSFAHIDHLLAGFPLTPGKIGFLAGLVSQARLLDIQAAVLQNAASNQNTSAIECAAQSMLDIIEGSHGSHYHPLPADCAQQNVTVTGDGFGLLGKNGYIAGAEEHASFALGQPDATPAMHQHAVLMEMALTNVTGWLTTIEQDALKLQAHPTDVTAIQAVTTLADYAYHGVDVNGNGQIDPVAGEAGALTAYVQGQLMATLSLAPPA